MSLTVIDAPSRLDGELIDQYCCDAPLLNTTLVDECNRMSFSFRRWRRSTSLLTARRGFAAIVVHRSRMQVFSSPDANTGQFRMKDRSYCDAVNVLKIKEASGFTIAKLDGDGSRA